MGRWYDDTVTYKSCAASEFILICSLYEHCCMPWEKLGRRIAIYDERHSRILQIATFGITFQNFRWPLSILLTYRLAIVLVHATLSLVELFTWIFRNGLGLNFIGTRYILAIVRTWNINSMRADWRTIGKMAIGSFAIMRFTKQIRLIVTIYAVIEIIAYGFVVDANSCATASECVFRTNWLWTLTNHAFIFAAFLINGQR